MRSEISAVSQAIRNSQRASTIIATTEGALDEVASLLRDIQSKLVEAANRGAMSDEEIQANQLQIDSSIASITRIANTTTFAGRHLLNGQLGYVSSGVVASQVATLDIHGVQFGSQNYITANVDVTVSAQPATLEFRASALTSAVTIELQGRDGATTLSFGSGTGAAQIASAINSVSDATGLSATASAAGVSGFRIDSMVYGSQQFAQVQPLPGGGPFDLVDTAGNAATRVIGRDASATINGAATIGDGNQLSLKTAQLDLELMLDQGFGTGTTSFVITSGGALFQVGPQITSSLQINIGVDSVAASRLGNADIGFLSQVVTGGQYSLTNGNEVDASKIVTEAIRQVSVLRGRLGAFEKATLETNINQLGITMENLMASDSTIRDADFAYETSQLTRSQVLVQSGTSALGLANQVPQSVLQLLG